MPLPSPETRLAEGARSGLWHQPHRRQVDRHAAALDLQRPAIALQRVGEGGRALARHLDRDGAALSRIVLLSSAAWPFRLHGTAPPRLRLWAGPRRLPQPQAAAEVRHTSERVRPSGAASGQPLVKISLAGQRAPARVPREIVSGEPNNSPRKTWSKWLTQNPAPRGGGVSAFPASNRGLSRVLRLPPRALCSETRGLVTTANPMVVKGRPQKRRRTLGLSG